MFLAKTRYMRGGNDTRYFFNYNDYSTFIFLNSTMSQLNMT